MSVKDVDFKIVDLILSSGILPKETRNDPIFHECIHELSALPMCRLLSESSYLRDCHRRIIEENYKLAFDNYSTFIQTAECTKQIFKDFEIVEKKNEILSIKIPSFVNSCNNFIEKCRKSISMANMNSLTLKNHNQILEILEIPQLLEACIRNNYLDEALEIIAHTRKLERRHQNIDIIMNVAHESRLAAQKLLDQLFQQLGGNLQLPACLKIVGYLRRMDCLPDSLLRMKFLQCRDNYLKNLLRSLPTNDSFFHAIKYMETTRVNLFDITTQYRAVFNDDDMYLSSEEIEGPHQGMLFSSWLVMRVRSFMISLAEDLELIVQNSVDYNQPNSITHSTKTSSQSVGSKLQSLLGQAMYFGLSLSRIGSDFRGLLMPMFYHAILKYVELRLNEISDLFIDSILSYKWTLNLDTEEMGTVHLVIRVANELLRVQKSDEIGAPNKLMNHPLLAMLINQMLSILDDIRICCPRVLKERICQSFSSTIDVLMNCLVKYYHDESPNFSKKEQQQFLFMASAFVSDLLPHINLCLIVLFASDTAPLIEQEFVLDINKLSNNFITILPESFFLRPIDEEMIVSDDDIHEQLELISSPPEEAITKNRIVTNENPDNASLSTEIEMRAETHDTSRSIPGELHTHLIVDSTDMEKDLVDDNQAELTDFNIDKNKSENFSNGSMKSFREISDFNGNISGTCVTEAYKNKSSSSELVTVLDVTSDTLAYFDLKTDTAKRSTSDNEDFSADDPINNCSEPGPSTNIDNQEESSDITKNSNPNLETSDCEQLKESINTQKPEIYQDSNSDLSGIPLGDGNNA